MLETALDCSTLAPELRRETHSELCLVCNSFNHNSALTLRQKSEELVKELQRELILTRTVLSRLWKVQCIYMNNHVYRNTFQIYM